MVVNDETKGSYSATTMSDKVGLQEGQFVANCAGRRWFGESAEPGMIRAGVVGKGQQGACICQGMCNEGRKGNFSVVVHLERCGGDLVILECILAATGHATTGFLRTGDHKRPVHRLAVAVVRADGNAHGGCQHHEGKQDMQDTVQGLFA